jgi:hypothetical protein
MTTMTLHTQYSPQQKVMLFAPPLLVVSMYFIFQGLHRLLGYPLGYLAGFAVYWLGWCLLLPLGVLGGMDKVMALLGSIVCQCRVQGRFDPLVYPFACRA